MKVSTISLKVLILDAYVDTMAQYKEQMRSSWVSGRQYQAIRFTAVTVVET
jgi:hypothetical protein